jgi:formylglycine-generating enzyme required for sulfatase activity
MIMVLAFLAFLACNTEPITGLAASSNSSAATVSISSGTYQMGRPTDSPGDYGQRWKENEMPIHEVTLSGYEIDQQEVTVSEWAAFLNDIGGDTHHHPLQPLEWDGALFHPITDREAHPINHVNWYDAAVFCAWAGKRLPTEAEWERAAKGPDDETRRWPWVDGGPTCQNTVFYTDHTLCEPGPAAVGSRSPAGDSQEGVQDLSGNVAEWVWDWYDRYDENSQIDPTGPAQGTYKILRGGGFRETDGAIRNMARTPGLPAQRSEGVGFRCAASL